MQSNVNAALNEILRLKRQGFTPQAVMNMMLRQNPQLQTALQQMQNMAQGRSPRDFVMQLAKQNGVDLTEFMRQF